MTKWGAKKRRVGADTDDAEDGHGGNAAYVEEGPQEEEDSSFRDQDEDTVRLDACFRWRGICAAGRGRTVWGLITTMMDPRL